MVPVPEIPWADPPTWRQANQTLALLVDRQAPFCTEQFDIAREIQKLQITMAPMMERLCRATCPWCPQPCCLSANIWFDFRDLLFLHWSQSAIPLAQPRARRGEICRFLGPKGCSLPRLMRPWLCTWYVCPTQTAFWRKVAPAEMADFKRLACRVRDLRQRLETVFIFFDLP